MENRHDNCIVYVLHNIHTQFKIKAVEVWKTDTIIVLFIYYTTYIPKLK